MAESSSRDSRSMRSEAAKRRRLDEELLLLLDAKSSTGSSASSSSDSSSSRDDDDDLTLYEFMFEYLFSPPEQLPKVESYQKRRLPHILTKRGAAALYFKRVINNRPAFFLFTSPVSQKLPTVTVGCKCACCRIREVAALPF
ncbi:hypothetical protein MRX96_047890 [Rhipicephalus microplus]